MKCPVCNSSRIDSNNRESQCQKCGYTHRKHLVFDDKEKIFTNSFNTGL